ncbi:MAG: chitin-binding domain-containing protein [Oscillatoria princeps RMCB-10]|jgi:hypothetical protein|nr:chitin-binding domain-containing protein [Oscillatoria princeps RMCB-10]
MNNHKSNNADLFERNPSATAAGAGAEGVVGRRDLGRDLYYSLSDRDLESIVGGDEVGSTYRGSFSFVTPDGQKFTVDYIA